jgi:uncharacterized protein with HEPN domain
MKKIDRKIIYLLYDIKKSLKHIKEDFGEIQKKQFLIDGKTHRSVIYSLNCIGEASKGIIRRGYHHKIEEKFPELWLQFKKLYELRNMLSHEYHRIGAETAWNTVKIYLPEFEKLVSVFDNSYCHHWETVAITENLISGAEVDKKKQKLL